MSSAGSPRDGAPEPRWRSRRVLGGLVRVLIVVVPVATAVVVAIMLGTLLPPPSGPAGEVTWWAGVLGGSLLALWLVDRVARRFLPLAALLELCLLFPDRAPSRMRMARRAMRGGFERRLRDAVHLDEAAEPVHAAEIVLSLLASLTIHDRRTRGHSERVHLFADLIAEELHLPQPDRDRLRWAAMLHDIGKLAVPGHVLNKQTVPDDDEWAVLHRHPDEGARLVAPLRGWLGEWSDTVVQHHERFDGGGYPAGLSGTDISMGARIVAVADAFEVMTAARSYRRPVSPAAAREELATCAGGQFDPTVVRALLTISLGRLRWVVGPLAILAQIPVVGRATSVAAAPRSLVAGAAVAGALGLGLLPPPGIPTPPSVGEEVAEAANKTQTLSAGAQGARPQRAAARRPADRHPAAVGQATTPVSQHAGVTAARAVPPRLPQPAPAAEPVGAVEVLASGGTRALGDRAGGDTEGPTMPDGQGADGPSPGRRPGDDVATDPVDPADPGDRLEGDARAGGGKPAQPGAQPEPDGSESDEEAHGEADAMQRGRAPRSRAEDDLVVTRRDVPVVADVLANDVLDPEGFTLDVIVTAKQGEVTLNPDDTVTYRPAEGFVGSDRFRYKVCSASGGRCTTATVRVLVEA